MSALIEKLKDFGCSEDDLNRAMEQTGEKYYFQINCPVSGNTNVTSSVFVTDNATDIFNHAHTLKGVTANMGITPVYDEECIIVEAVRDSSIVPEGLDVHYKNILDYYKRLQEMVG